MMSWSPVILTLELALVTTFVLFILCVPLAYWLAETKSKFKPFVEAIVSLPLVLPPTVLGFYLLLMMSPKSAIGGFLHDTLGLSLVFSFPGLVIGSVIYSLPFMVQPLQNGFGSIPDSIKEAGIMLGKSKWQMLRRVILPCSKHSILVALILTFAHTVGEFGVVLMIGGNIPNETKVMSIAIYEEVEAMNYIGAYWYSGVLLLFSFAVLLFVYLRNQKPWIK